ncbi:tyrosine-type recombinase/integrase [Caballeronia sp. NCTM5]|uniref:tyrosine-type recombinase/integrase n=1 Tax=Caballeronia sp. NCTM5 TaxID=2921755 RepID=UPI0020281E96|nr:tyrosine-type recombinase/integrase [Caballeronia sp. NCTM5]
MAARRREAKRRHWPANLYQNGDGYFYWRNPDTRRDFGIGRDQAKAFGEARAANAELEKSRGYVSLVQRMTAPDEKTLQQWSEEYETIYAETRKPTKSTMQTVRAGLRAVRTAPFIEKHIRAVSTREVAEFIDGAIETRGPNMAKLIRKTLLDMMNVAETKGLIETGKNPVSVTRTPDIEVARSRLTLDQFQRIYQTALGSDPWVARSMELALVCAQRREDVANIQFSDVRDGFLFVEQQKTGARIRIPVGVRCDAVGLSLDDVVKRCRDAAVSKWLIHYTQRRGERKAGHPVGLQQITRRFAAARNSTEGLVWEEGKDPASFHEIRSLAARLYADQYSPEFAQAILGHKSASMTDLYRDVRGAEWVEVKLAG